MEGVRLDFSQMNQALGGSSSKTGSAHISGSPQGITKLTDSGKASENFANTLQSAIENVNQLQKESDKKIQDLATGRTENLHDVMIAMEKADLGLRLMVQVRNKVIEAYQEIMKMQV